MALDPGIVKNLHPLEVRVLRHFESGAVIGADELTAALGYNVGQCNQAFSWLAAKGLVAEKERSVRNVYEITELGRAFAQNGTPEERMLELVQSRGPLRIPEIVEALGIENKDAGSAFGALSKEGSLAMDGEKRVALADPARSAGRLQATRNLLRRGAEAGSLTDSELNAEERTIMEGIAKKRGAADAPFKAGERETVRWQLLPEAAQVRRELEAGGITGEELGVLTPDMLAKGSWKGKTFRSYNVNSPAARLVPGRTNPYCDYLRWVKDKLIALGFAEFDGPLVETEFWNCDALFMPQFHSARDIHDVYHVKKPTRAKKIDQPWLGNVAAAHQDGGATGSRGWGYTFDNDFTRRLILRSQGTVLSAKQLPTARVPGKYFGVARCFRYDQVDATHLSDFYQTEGIILGEDVNLRNLLGLLKMFAEQIAGATEVKYVPGYFPFTEPSVEVHIKHPVLGWFELGGSGIFRPEVTKPLGIDVPVLAWGLGIDRMALMHLGLNDLRELFSYNIEAVRTRRSK